MSESSRIAGFANAPTVAVLTGASVMLTMSMGMRQSFGLRYMATLTGIAFLSRQAGSFMGAWGGGLLFDALGSYDLAWQLGVAIGITAGVAQIFMNDRPTPRMHAAAA